MALDLVLRDTGVQRGLPTTVAGRLLSERSRSLIEAGERLGAGNIRVFGSVARGADGPQSDIDLLVDLSPSASLIDLGKLAEAFSGVLGRKVDVVPASALKTSMRDQVLAEAIPLGPA